MNLEKKQKKIYSLWIILGFALIILALLYALYGVKIKEIQVASELLGSLSIILMLIFFGAFLIHIGLAVSEQEKKGE